MTLPATVGQTEGKEEIVTENGGIVGNGAFFGCTSLARMRILFDYPLNSGLTVIGSSVFDSTGKDVEGGLRIVVPAQFVENFISSWTVGSGEKFSFYSDAMLYGNYLMKDSGGYVLEQYMGDADVIAVDLNFAGHSIVGLGDSLFVSSEKISYGEFTLMATIIASMTRWSSTKA